MEKKGEVKTYQQRMQVLREEKNVLFDQLFEEILRADGIRVPLDGGMEKLTLRFTMPMGDDKRAAALEELKKQAKLVLHLQNRFKGVQELGFPGMQSINWVDLPGEGIQFTLEFQPTPVPKEEEDPITKTAGEIGVTRDELCEFLASDCFYLCVLTNGSIVFNNKIAELDNLRHSFRRPDLRMRCNF